MECKTNHNLGELVVRILSIWPLYIRFHLCPLVAERKTIRADIMASDLEPIGYLVIPTHSRAPDARLYSHLPLCNADMAVVIIPYQVSRP